MNIVLIGMMGSGKSTIAKLLSNNLKLELIDSDELIEKNSNKSIKEIFETHGEVYFRKLEKETFKMLRNKENIIISTGGGAVLNDTLIPIKDNNIIYLKWSIKGLLKNLKSKIDNRPLLDDDSLEEKLSSIYLARKDLYEKWAKHVIECDDKTIDQVVDAILKSSNI